jgi:hypothetical protein
MTDFTGTAGNDDLTGTADADAFDMTQGGSDTARGAGGDDTISFGAVWDDSDRIFGGAGNDGLILAGEYAAPLVFDHGNFRGIETILLFGDSFSLIFEDGALADGQTLEVDLAFGVGGLGLFAPETSAAFNVFAGDGSDSIVTGSGNDTINAGDGFSFIVPGAGNDTILCGDGGALIRFFTGEFNGKDKIDGGDTANDNVVELDGDYSGGIRLGALTLANIQEFRVMGGHDYVIDFGRVHVTENTGMLIEGRGLGATDRIDVDLSRVNEQLAFEGGAGDDAVIGNAESGFMRGGLGADRLEGGAGFDIHKYDAAADSTGKTFDTVVGFDTDFDIFTLDSAGFSAMGGVDATVGSGRLATATFNSDLKAVIGSGQLGAHHAVLFKPDAGNLAGSVFLIVDANGIAGYQKDADLVIRLVDGHHLGDLSTGDFFVL